MGFVIRPKAAAAKPSPALAPERPKNLGGRPKGSGTRYDWPEIRNEWEQSNLQGRPMTLKDLAAKHKIPYESIRNRSSLDGWAKALEEKMQLVTDMVAERSRKTQDEVLTKLQEEFVGNEVEIRTRHAKVARGLQAKAVARLAKIPIDQLKPMEAIAMLKLGIDEERRAMGLPDTYVHIPASPMHPEYKSVMAAVGDHKKIQGLGLKLLQLMQEQSKTITVDENPLEAVGLGAKNANADGAP